jgi:tetratricopeptide (TPR) repeat protein
VGRFLYRAEADGKPVSGIQDADSAAEAVALLKEQGLQAVRLQSDAMSAAMPLDTNGLADQDYAELRHYFQARHGLRPFLLMLLKQTWLLWLLTIPGAVLLWLADYRLWAGLLLLVPLTMAAIALWKYRDARDFDAMLSAIALGYWQKAASLGDRLGRRIRDESVAMELTVQRACLQARTGETDEALATLAPWQPVMDMLMPGMYAAQQARVYLAAGEHEAQLCCHREAVAASQQDPSQTLDYALMEARYGSAARAHCLLLEVDPALLPEYGDAFVPWVEGIVALRQGRDQAAATSLSLALDRLQLLAGNPAVWPTLAMVGGDAARVLLRLGQSDEAAAMVDAVWPVLAVHGEPDQLAALAPVLPSNV